MAGEALMDTAVMSYVTLSQVKADLRVIHNADDTLLQILIDASEDEALRFMNRDEMPTLPYELPEESSSEEEPSSGDPIAPSVYAAIFLMVRAKYEGKSAEEIAALRLCAETILQPYRTEIGM